MITRAEVVELWQAWNAAQDELRDSELFRRVEDLRLRYSRALAEVEAQEEMEEAQGTANYRADRKAAFKAEFAAAKDKRPLRELVADETVVGTFEGWRFGTTTGSEIRLRQLGYGGDAGKLAIDGNAIWEGLRDQINKRGRWPRVWFRNKAIEGFGAIRSSDQTRQNFPVDNVVAWKAGGE